MKLPLSVVLGLFCAGCAQGNLDPVVAHKGPPAPPVKAPFYDPTMAYGSAPARWQPITGSAQGLVVPVADPANQSKRPDYEHAPWNTQAQSALAGTF